MKTAGLFLLLVVTNCVLAQTSSIEYYTRQTYMVPMRDGVKLFTSVLTPDASKESLPILLQRTPYGAYQPERLDVAKAGPMTKAGYIFVVQDIRGKFKSEGTFEMNRPLYHLTDKSKTDESTDAYDAIEWLIKNIPNNNGKVGIYGVSYLGYTALDASSDPHPALKASSPQASPTDMFLGDDFHHNGAFRLSYGFEYSYLVENAKEDNSSFPFPQYDLYDWYLQLGPLKNVNTKYFKNRLPSWNDFAAHPNYDSFWKKQSMLTGIQQPQLPLLHVGGYYDQEDLNGPQLMYSHLEKNDKNNFNHLVLGPWSHGQWGGKGDSLGQISFGGNTGEWFRQLQKQWFDYWLKGQGDGKFAEAYCFQTGSNQWKNYPTWPPKESELKKLYTLANGSLSFDKPKGEGSVSYVSDPSKPVPYRARPIEATYGQGSRWSSWQVEDQRFVDGRPDVVSFVTDSLKEELTLTGKISAHLLVSTTGSDADFVVKVIDVYPNFDKRNFKMSGFQMPVTMEVFRGRFRKSFEKPEPFTAGKAEEVVIDLHQVNHTFLKGHRVMVQIQSTWFPIIDRNPQKFVPSIFEATNADYIQATHTIHCGGNLTSYVELPVVKP
ncbi:MAG TPA: CocE/NonD family hydrolase [Cyclobacteriaceae bacterium]|jgi:putative CocE/NonD family hydrolase|nr:CocE/NonD family hydrolase [Cyclobacteriaceae bacterium]